MSRGAREEAIDDQLLGRLYQAQRAGQFGDKRRPYQAGDDQEGQGAGWDRNRARAITRGSMDPAAPASGLALTHVQNDDEGRLRAQAPIPGAAGDPGPAMAVL